MCTDICPLDQQKIHSHVHTRSSRRTARPSGISYFKTLLSPGPITCVYKENESKLIKQNEAKLIKKKWSKKQCLERDTKGCLFYSNKPNASVVYFQSTLKAHTFQTFEYTDVPMTYPLCNNKTGHTLVTCSRPTVITTPRLPPTATNTRGCRKLLQALKTTRATLPPILAHHQPSPWSAVARYPVASILVIVRIASELPDVRRVIRLTHGRPYSSNKTNKTRRNGTTSGNRGATVTSFAQSERRSFGRSRMCWARLSLISTPWAACIAY